MTIDENIKVRYYKIISKIGQGGMGEVYLAEDENLGRKVAIKILPIELTRDYEIIERFRQEARLQASLIHPNIVSLFTFFEEQGTYVMVLEYAEGITLKELINRTGPIPEQRAQRIFLQILEGVSFAHNKGIIHRDIKPSNIMVDMHDNVKIMDFGIAKVLGDRGLTRTGTKMGTIFYMSPEQIKAEKDIDQRTDIYSLGICLYEMLTGQLPFNIKTESDFEIMKEIVEKEFKYPREIYPHISDLSISILSNLTQKERADRIKNARDVILLITETILTKNQFSSEYINKVTEKRSQITKDKYELSEEKIARIREKSEELKFRERIKEKKRILFSFLILLVILIIIVVLANNK